MICFIYYSFKSLDKTLKSDYAVCYVLNSRDDLCNHYNYWTSSWYSANSQLSFNCKNEKKIQCLLVTEAYRFLQVSLLWLWKFSTKGLTADSYLEGWWCSQDDRSLGLKGNVFTLNLLFLCWANSSGFFIPIAIRARLAAICSAIFLVVKTPSLDMILSPNLALLM